MPIPSASRPGPLHMVETTRLLSHLSERQPSQTLLLPHPASQESEPLLLLTAKLHSDTLGPRHTRSTQIFGNPDSRKPYGPFRPIQAFSLTTPLPLRSPSGRPLPQLHPLCPLPPRLPRPPLPHSHAPPPKSPSPTSRLPSRPAPPRPSRPLPGTAALRPSSVPTRPSWNSHAPHGICEFLTGSRTLELDVSLDLLEEFLHGDGGPAAGGRGGWGAQGPGKGGARRGLQPERKYSVAGSPASARPHT
jgi:hypothetical protein